LLVEYYEDLFEDDPHAVLDAMRGEDGEIVFDDVEDPLIAKWEAELAKGALPDLEEGLSEKAKKQLATERDKSERAKSQVKQLQVKDDFTKKAEQVVQRVDKKFESKFVTPGSAEDRAMRSAAVLGRHQRGKQQQPETLGGGVKRRGR
jgi:deoxyribodipyrimidine photolyase